MAPERTDEQGFDATSPPVHGEETPVLGVTLEGLEKGTDFTCPVCLDSGKLL